MNRKNLRENCFKLLFCIGFYQEEEREEQITLYFEEPAEEETLPDGTEELLHDPKADVQDMAYLKEKIGQILEHLEELDAAIDAVAQGWKTSRMGKAELSILRLALFEMKYDDSVPVKVAINEAVELAKKFGGNDSPSFVNGILAKLV
ncbi:MAG: transcription antitermination factor NusB [bacterium]|nr:transcription antitermination factor NusB [bacterium]